MDFLEAFEESLKELGIDNLDDNPDDIPAGTDEKAEDDEPEDGATESKPVEEDSDAEGADETEDDSEVDVPVFEIVEDSNLKLPDGTVISAKQALLRQSDYTRKTQELAEQRKDLERREQEQQGSIAELREQFEQVTEWYNERSQRPSDWIAEIAETSSDPTATIAKALFDLAQAGVLDKQFVETFGIEAGPVQQKAEKFEVNSELEELKAWKRQQQEQQQRHELVKQQTQRYEREWAGIKDEKGLTFSSQADEFEAKRELLQFALESGMTNSLVDAYDLMTVRKPRASRKTESAPQTSDKKRASRAVTPKTAISGQAKRTKKVVSDRDAILEAMESLSL